MRSASPVHFGGGALESPARLNSGVESLFSLPFTPLLPGVSGHTAPSAPSLKVPAPWERNDPVTLMSWDVGKR